MAKRFSDTDKWKKPFIRSLQAPYKLFWLYILDDCDHAGIWQVDMEIANIKLGESLTIETALSQFGDKIKVFDNGEKWFIKDFIDFQYGELNPKNRVHESVLSILKKYKLCYDFKPLTSPLQGAKDKDKEKDKDKDIYLKEENFEKNDYFIVNGKIEKGNVVDWYLQNHQPNYEALLMQLSLSSQDEKIKQELRKYFINGFSFNDYKHIANSFKKHIIEHQKELSPKKLKMVY